MSDPDSADYFDPDSPDNPFAGLLDMPVVHSAEYDLAIEANSHSHEFACIGCGSTEGVIARFGCCQDCFEADPYTYTDDEEAIAMYSSGDSPF